MAQASQSALQCVIGSSTFRTCMVQTVDIAVSTYVRLIFIVSVLLCIWSEGY